MKKLFYAILCVALGIFMGGSLTACGKDVNSKPNDYTRPANPDIDRSFEVESDVLVAYFSKTNTTKGVAEKIAELSGADIFEIERKEHYPAEYTPTTEVAKDEKDDNARPELKTYLPDEVIESYDTIILGFPIWWHTAPMAVLSFLNYYDLSGKTIITFCTSGGSSIDESTADIRSNAKDATVVEGRRFSNGNDSAIEGWLEGLNLLKSSDTATGSLTYEKNGNEYHVTGMTGAETNVVIPAEYENLPVTKIKESAFAYSRHNEEILSVVIPDSVTEIERNAFYNRDEMTTVDIGQNSRLETIGNNVFSGNHSLKSIYIPSGVTEIGDSAFNNDGEINFTVASGNTTYRSEKGHLIETATNTLIRGGQSGRIPESVSVIAPSAFRRSQTITKLYIPASVTAIGNYFISDSSITSVSYLGTEEEWDAVEKTSMWNSGNREVELLFGQAVNNVLVVYFSAQNHTEAIANYIAEACGGDLFELNPENPYTSADLNWNNSDSRVSREHNDESLRNVELTAYTPDDWENYDTVFIGYPIWWGIAAWPVNGFVTENDFSNKTVIPFCTSSSSGLGQSGTLLAEMAGTGDWQTGRRFSSSASQSTVTEWVNSLVL